MPHSFLYYSVSPRSSCCAEMSFNKLVLISADRLSSLEAAKPSEPVSFLTRTEEELRKLLEDSNKSEDEKVQLYSGLLRQLVSHLHPPAVARSTPEKEVPKEERPQEVGETRQPSEMPAFDKTITDPPTIPEPRLNSSQKEQLLRDHMLAHPEVFGYGPEGELMLNGHVIKDSNAEDIISDFSNAHRWNSQAYSGSSRLAAALKLTGFPKEHIANKSRQWDDEALDRIAVANWPNIIS